MAAHGNNGPQPDPANSAGYPARLQGYRLDEHALPTSLVALATQARATHADRPALTLVLPQGMHASLSFAEVDALSDDFAAYLRHDLALQVGDVVALQMPNSLHYAVAAFGAWKAGAIATNVNPLCTASELTAQLQDCAAKVLVATVMSLATLRPAAAETGVAVVLAGLWDFFSTPAAQALREALGGEVTLLETECTFAYALTQGRRHGPLAARHHEVALLQYTGGTTGRSKGAVLTHRNVLAVLQMTDDYLSAHDAPFLPSDVVLTVLPLYHVFAFVINFLSFFRKGARNLLVPNPRPLKNVEPALRQFEVSWITGVDTLYAGLLAEPWFIASPPALRYAISGGTALRPSTGQRWRDTVGPMLEGYGLTETSCIVACSPPNRALQPGSVGLPMPGSEVRVVDAQGEAVPHGERGELQVRGPHVTRGYRNRPDDNAAAFSGDWFRTGDIVTMAPDGSIHIVDRLKDMVLVSGFNVYPNEVEAVIAAHPDVAEVAVVGMPDEATGEAVCAYVTPRHPGLTAEQVVAHCRLHLTRYKVPKRVLFRDGLPKSPVGKILRAQLRGES
ncbi:AMP-binding protein [Variovorax sp. H27-G14]|uniref:AMP-binding protein n=1 Tax=Variovorax sp. H27-G14 TaxID=3111914 RepID=UPI0038FBEB73